MGTLNEQGHSAGTGRGRYVLAVLNIDGRRRTQPCTGNLQGVGVPAITLRTPFVYGG